MRGKSLTLGAMVSTRTRLVSSVVAAVFVAAVCTSASGGAGAALRSSAVRAEAAAGSSNWIAYHGSRYRHGVSPTMPAVRGSLAIARRVALDAKVYASPIVINGVTIVATENNTVYAFGPNYGLRWAKHLGPPARASELPCGNIDPLGITGTPVYGAKYNVVYVAAELGGPPRHRLYALSFTDGTRRWDRSLDLPDVETRAMQQRGALTVTGGRVWVPFGGLAGDCGAYKGRLVGYYRYGGGTPASYTVPTTREGGIWTPPGPVLDKFGQMYVAVGNGAAGVGDPYDHSDSVLKLGPGGRLRGSFSPSTWASDNDADLDLGSLGPTLLSNDKWVFIAGKSGYAYVLERRRLGGIGGAVSRRFLCAAFGGTASVGDTVYVPCADGVRAVRVGAVGRISVLWHASTAIIGSPVVGGGRVWSLDPSGGVLYGLDLTTGRVRNHITVGPTSRFATPAIAGRTVIVPTLSGITVVSTS